MTGIARASATLGAGTVVSRLTGVVRSIVLAAAIGSFGGASNAFMIANQLPNNVFAIISYGLLTAVIVPQIVKSGAHADGGDAFVSKLITLGGVALVVITALAVTIAPALVRLYQPQFDDAQAALATAFAYWCLPQILFYGLYSLVGETLNARRVYGPFTWAPIVNNLVSIAGFGAMIALFGSRPDVEGWTPGMITLLGATATGGIALQALVLVFFWRRTGLRFRLDFAWRGVGLGGIGRLAGWTLLMVLAGQLAGLVQARVLPPDDAAGVAASSYAWLLFMLPYSVIVLSIGTPYFTRLSEHAGAGRLDDVRADIAQSIRTVGVFMVIATVALAVAAVPACRLFTGSADQSVALASVLWCFLVGLVPLSVLFVVQRTFYALDDTRTPFVFTTVQCALVAGTALLAGAVAPPEHLAAAVALGQSLSTLVQVLLGGWLLHRRLGSMRAAEWTRALGRFALCAVPAAAVGVGVYLVLGGPDGWTGSSVVAGAIGAAIVGTVTVAAYVGVLALARAPELTPAAALVGRLVPARLRGSRAAE